MNLIYKYSLFCVIFVCIAHTNTCYGQVQQYNNITVVFDIKGNRIKNFFANGNTGKLFTVAKKSIASIDKLKDSKIVYDLFTANYTPSLNGRFYIKFTFEEITNNNNEILFHFSFYDIVNTKWLQTSSHYTKWDIANEPEFLKSLEKLIETQLLSDLQYFMKDRLVQPKKAIFIHPVINIAKCVLPANSGYAGFLSGCPRDISEKIKLLGKSKYLYLIAKTSCFEISLEASNPNNIGESRAKFNIISSGGSSVPDVTLDKLYEMWLNHNKKFEELCSAIYNKLSSSQKCP